MKARSFLAVAALALVPTGAWAGETDTMSQEGETETTVAADTAEGDAETVSMEAFDAAAGETLYRKECRACHGPTAKGVSSYPRLVDQPFDYLVDRLERYRAGETFGPNTMLMAPRAKKLSDEDIGNVAKFIVSIE